MLYCSSCGTEYRDEAQECAHCPGSALQHEPPPPRPWGGAQAGWYVVVGGNEPGPVREASALLEDEGVPHMVLQRDAAGWYRPADGEADVEPRPLTFEDWSNEWLLVTPRPMFEAAVSLVKTISSDEPEEPEQGEIPPRLPWDASPSPMGPHRRAFGVLIAGVIGFGIGLLVIRRYRPLLVCVPLQLAILLPALPEISPDPLFAALFLLGRLIEVAIVIRDFLRPA